MSVDFHIQNPSWISYFFWIFKFLREKLFHKKFLFGGYEKSQGFTVISSFWKIELEQSSNPSSSEKYSIVFEEFNSDSLSTLSSSSWTCFEVSLESARS